MNTDQHYYLGPERRTARSPRRSNPCRRHRIRRESLVSDCRTLACRREEDRDGFVEVSSLYEDRSQDQSSKPPQKRK